MALKLVRVWSKCSLFNPVTLTHKFHASYCVLRRPFASYERDPAPYFFDSKVQRLMMKLTKKDLKKIYKDRKTGETLYSPTYKFLTTEELQKYMKAAEKKAARLLQVPPIVKEREDINEVLSEDPALKGFDEAKFVFTDITFGVKDKDRIIVVREPEGVLRQATWDERYRINQIYFPQTDRYFRIPHMFDEQYLVDILDRGDYVFVLERACNQFEPNDPEYHRVTSTTYDHVEKLLKFDSLQYTRHFGALCFYLCWHKRIDNFLLYHIQNNELDSAVLLIKLFHCLNPKSASADANSEDAVQFVQAYIQKDSERKSVLELALRSYLELEKQRDLVDEGVKRAHGLTS